MAMPTQRFTPSSQLRRSRSAGSERAGRGRRTVDRGCGERRRRSAHRRATAGLGDGDCRHRSKRRQAWRKLSARHSARRQLVDVDRRCSRMRRREPGEVAVRCDQARRRRTAPLCQRSMRVDANAMSTRSARRLGDESGRGTIAVGSASMAVQAGSRRARTSSPSCGARWPRPDRRCRRRSPAAIRARHAASLSAGERSCAAISGHAPLACRTSASAEAIARCGRATRAGDGAVLSRRIGRREGARA